MKRQSLLLAGVIYLVMTGSVSSAGQDLATFRIGGRVSSSVKLSLARQDLKSAANSLRNPEISMMVEANEDGALQFMLSGKSSGSASTIYVPVEIRTNVDYSLKLRLISFDGCRSSISAAIGSVSPTGPMVKQGAVDTINRSPPTQLKNDNGSHLLLEGQRVSYKGNFNTPGNALLIELVLTVSEHRDSDCFWKSSLLLLLRPLNTDS